MLASLPTVTYLSMPMPRRSAVVMSCTPMLPDWETMLRRPACGRNSVKPTAWSRTCVAIRPMQLGPTSVTPEVRAVRTSSASAAAPASPASEKPAATTSTAGMPRRPHCSTTAFTWAAPSVTSARSGASGSSATLRNAGRPQTVPPRRFTG